MKSYYQTLGLSSRQAAPDEVEAAYNRLAGEFADNADYQKAIGEAYATLIDPQQRAAYDRRLAAAEAVEANRDSDVRSAPAGNWRWLGLLSLAVAAGGYYHTTRPKVPPSIIQAPAAVEVSRLLSRCRRKGRRQLSPSRSNRSACWKSRLLCAAAQGNADSFCPAGQKAGVRCRLSGVDDLSCCRRQKPGFRRHDCTGQNLTNCHVVAGNAMSGLIVINSATRERPRWTNIPNSKTTRMSACSTHPAHRLISPSGGAPRRLIPGRRRTPSVFPATKD
jgi:hypothetical protein